MKIERFNENSVIGSGEHSKKFYVFSVNPYDRTYRGSLWDSPSKPWIPYDSELIAEFELSNRNYMIVNQDELNEINKIKEEIEIEKNAKKYNL